MTEPSIHIFGGGTVFHVRPHLAISAPAYGQTAKDLERLLGWNAPRLHLTRMAGGERELETNEDVRKRLEKLTADPNTKVIFMSAALCDFEASVLESDGRGTNSGKDRPRLKTAHGKRTVELTPADKLIGSIRKERKDIFLVGFKTTAGASADDQYLAGLGLLKGSSCNLVLANDLHTKLNMVITPEQARYHETTDRGEALKGLVEMTLLRSKGTFTRSTVVEGEAVPWNESIPYSLRRVVDHCIDRGAYKPFDGKTVGHFAFKVDDKEFITSKRKTNFNHLRDIGMVRVEAQDDHRVTAYGAKPSVGGQSQRIIFREHPDVDCIFHAHIPLKADAPDNIPVREQRPYECGSHECGKNTSDGLKDFDGIKAVMLDKHGPNVVFNRDIDPAKVIAFIEANFDLRGRTDNLPTHA